MSSASRLAAALQSQFQRVARAVTLRCPAPKLLDRRRSGETGRAFAPAAGLFTRRASTRAIVQAVHSAWDAMNWLQLWEGNDMHEDAEEFRTNPQQHLSMHL